MRLGHAKNCTMHPVHLQSAPCMQKVGAQLSFSASEMGKARTFSPYPGRNSKYKYQPSSFRTEAVQEEGYFRALGENLSSP